MFLSIIKSLKPSFEPLTESEFRDLFNTHFGQVRNFIYYKYRDPELAEDMAQEAFARLWETRGHIDRSTVRSYLFTISANMAKNIQIRNNVRFKFETSRHLSDRNHESPDYVLELEDFKKQLEGVLSDMPDGLRGVFLMSRIDDLKYKEISEIMGLSVKAVEKRISKARAFLLTKLGVDL